MITIFDKKTGSLVRNVRSLDGEDMEGCGITFCPVGHERMRWDTEKRCWVACEDTAHAHREMRFDAAYRAEHGQGSIEQAHRRLAVEARLWLHLKEPAVSAMLVAEATMRGVEVDDLAALIIEKDNEWIAREVARKQAKIGAVK